MSYSETRTTARRLRLAPTGRALSGWLRFGITALPQQGPPQRAR